jgi:hypothetical protein
MNPWQKLCCEVYGGGQFKEVAKIKDWRAHLDELGDGLFKFLIIELSDREDCNGWDDAFDRLCGAMSDINDIMQAMVEENQ